MRKRSCVTAFRALLLAAAACLPGGQAIAQSWPTRPVRLVVPYAPGGPVDVVTRSIGQRVAAALGQPWVIDNRPGGNTAIAAQHVARSEPDGHTLLLATPTVTINTLLQPQLGYRLDDFAPVANIVKVPYVLAVSAALPVRNLQELAGLARSRPSGLNNGMLGYGGTVHLTAELFRQASGIPIVHVPYRGGGPAVTALVSGEIDMYFTGTVGGIPQARSGTLRLLGITHDARLPDAPELPTFAEQGYPEVVSYAWYGVFAPAGVPAAILDRLATEIRRAAEEPEFLAQMERGGSLVDTVARDSFGRMIQDDLRVWSQVIDRMGDRLQR
jgi:tripartite-type tricarboxylate transporter receptor subunit TctC